MTTLIQESATRRDAGLGRLALVPLLAAGILVMFLLAPGTIPDKAHAVLHGLCAQRPSHSLALGNVILPMDARMTGIYFGAMATMVWLITTGRARASKTPPRQVLALLTAFMLAAALDGLNALAVDLGVAQLYQPSNVLRLATGALSGVALGVLLLHVFAVSVWARPDPHQAVVGSARELLPPLVLCVGVAGPAASGLGILYAPLAVGLVLAAASVFWMLAVVFISLATGRWRGCRATADLVPTAVAAFCLTLLAMAGLAALRLFAEQALLIPKMT